jgi:hypothetical protein
MKDVHRRPRCSDTEQVLERRELQQYVGGTLAQLAPAGDWLSASIPRTPALRNRPHPGSQARRLSLRFRPDGDRAR